MNYLPSKKFTQKVLAIFLVTLGWFYFFGTKNNASNQTMVEDRGGIIVFSRTNGTVSPNLGEAEDWGDLSQGNIIPKNSSLASITIPTKPNPDNLLEGLQRTGINSISSFADADKSDFENYGKELVTALKPYGNSNLPNEGQLVIESLGSGNHENLKTVGIMAQIHLAVAEELKKIKVPEEIKFRHLFLINNIETLSFVDQLMLGAFEDPKMGIDAVNLYNSTTASFMNSIIDINDFFTDKGIVFSKNEKIKIYINAVQ